MTEADGAGDRLLERVLGPREGYVTVHTEPGHVRYAIAGYSIQFQGGRPFRFTVDLGTCGSRRRREGLTALARGVQWWMTVHTPDAGEVRAQFMVSFSAGGRLVAEAVTPPTVNGMTVDLAGLARHLWGSRAIYQRPEPL